MALVLTLKNPHQFEPVYLDLPDGGQIVVSARVVDRRIKLSISAPSNIKISREALKIQESK